MNLTAPRQRSPQFFDATYHSIPTATITTPPQPPKPRPNPRSFTPTPPFASAAFTPYSQPGYFLTPQSSLSAPHLPAAMWLWKGTGSHYVGLLALLAGCVVVFSLVTSMRHPLDVATVDATGGGGLGASRKQSQPQQQWGAGGADFDVHAALRPLVVLEPTITALSSFNVPTYYQRSNATLLSALAVHPQLLSHLQDTDHPTAAAGEAEKGLAVLLHGCNHKADDWFTLPEERRIVRLLLASGYSAIAFTSVDRDSGCWDNRWSSDNVDVQRVIAALQAFIAAHYVDGRHPALFIVGASSGGTFASVLARTVPTTAQCIIVSPGSDAALLTPTSHPAAQPYTDWSSAALSSADKLYSVPPTAWVYMPKDTHWASELKIASLRTAITQKASQLGHRIAKSTQPTLALPTKPHALTDTHMTDRLDAWAAAGQPGAGQLAALFFRLAHREGFVDRYGYLIDSPASSGMAAYMVDVMGRELGAGAGVAGGQGLVGVVRVSVAAVGEELALLWGEHEMTSEHMDEVVLWFERQRTRAAR